MQGKGRILQRKERTRIKNWKNKMKKGMAVMMLACLLFAWGDANEEAGIAPCVESMEEISRL